MELCNVNIPHWFSNSLKNSAMENKMNFSNYKHVENLVVAVKTLATKDMYSHRNYSLVTWARLIVESHGVVPEFMALVEVVDEGQVLSGDGMYSSWQGHHIAGP